MIKRLIHEARTAAKCRRRAEEPETTAWDAVLATSWWSPYPSPPSGSSCGGTSTSKKAQQKPGNTPHRAEMGRLNCTESAPVTVSHCGPGMSTMSRSCEVSVPSCQHACVRLKYARQRACGLKLVDGGVHTQSWQRQRCMLETCVLRDA